MTKSYMEVWADRPTTGGEHIPEWVNYAKEVVGRYGTTSWPVRIAEARNRGHFTENDVKAAGSWVTCACGQQDAEIARNEDGVPLDSDLAVLGMNFMNEVRGDRIESAERILACIQQRAAEVLTKLREENVR